MKKLNLWRRLGGALGLLGLIMLLAGAALKKPLGPICMVVGLAVALGAIVFGLVKLRCPSCHALLRGLDPHATSCPRCGADFRNETPKNGQ